MDIPGIKVLRSKEFTSKIIKAIKTTSKEISKPVKFMHVCGTHEHTMSKYGLRTLLPKEIEILSGPGCPVCICPAADIDKAIELGNRDDTIITTFGDMIRVPATTISLAELKAKGADIRIVYGPNDAVKIAKENPDKEIIFFAECENCGCSLDAKKYIRYVVDKENISVSIYVKPCLCITRKEKWMKK